MYVAKQLSAGNNHRECVDTERCTVLAHLLEYFGGFIWDLLSLDFLILKGV